MADKEKTIEVLQAIVTGLSANSFGHRIQSKVFAGLGFQSLGDKYATHATEEMDFVEQFMDRILDLVVKSSKRLKKLNQYTQI